MDNVPLYIGAGNSVNGPKHIIVIIDHVQLDNIKINAYKLEIATLYLFNNWHLKPCASLVLTVQDSHCIWRSLKTPCVRGCQLSLIAALLQNQFAVTDDGSPPAPRPCPPRLRPPYSLAISLFTFHYSLGRRHSASVLSVSVTKSILARDNDWWKIRTCNNSIASKFDILLDYYLGKKGVVDMLIVQFCTPKLYPVP